MVFIELKQILTGIRIQSVLFASRYTIFSFQHKTSIIFWHHSIIFQPYGYRVHKISQGMSLEVRHSSMSFERTLPYGLFPSLVIEIRDF